MLSSIASTRATSAPVFPPELEERILTLAARENRRDAIALARVAYRTRVWIEPIVYSKVVLDFPKSNVRSFKDAVKAKPASFFAEHVKILHMTQVVSSFHAEGFLKLCSGATEIICWAPLSPQTFAQTAPLETIQRLAVRRDTLYTPIESTSRTHVTVTINVPLVIHPSHFKALERLYVLVGSDATHDSIAKESETMFAFNTWAFHCPAIANFGIAHVPGMPKNEPGLFRLRLPWASGRGSKDGVCCWAVYSYVGDWKMIRGQEQERGSKGDRDRRQDEKWWWRTRDTNTSSYSYLLGMPVEEAAGGKGFWEAFDRASPREPDDRPW